MMTPDILIVLGVGMVAIALFVSERLPIDQVAIAVPPLLLLLGVIDLETAVSGLSNPATIAVASLLIMGIGLEKSGVVGAISRYTTRLAIGAPWLRLLLLCLVVAALSPFLSNVAVVVVFLPVFLALARDTGEQPSRVLMPLSYAAILGGTITLIGTSTNLIVHSAARNRGFDELSLFSITPLGLMYLGVGMVYMMTIGRRLLPSRPGGGALSDLVRSRVYTTELYMTERSPSLDTDPRQLDWAERYGLREVTPLDRLHHRPARSPMRLRPGDVLSVTGDAPAIFRCARSERLVTPAGTHDARVIDSAGSQIVELMIAPNSRLVGRTIAGMRFASRYDVVVLAVQRAHHPLKGRMTRARLAAGDMLLVQGDAEALASLAYDRAFVAIGTSPRHDRARGPGWLALAIMAAMVVAAATGITTIAEAALIGATVMIFTSCVRLDEIYREIDWQILALLAGLLPLGIALDTTGAADLLGRQLAAMLGGASPAIVVGCFYLVTSLLTELMSNQAAAIVLTPVAITTAERLDLNPYALIVAVMFGASAAFMTPVGYQTNALIYSPGGYRFTDYLRVGAPLNLILALLATLVIPWMWP